MQVNCGTVGISNLMKRHRGTKKCLELKARRDKKGKGMVQGSLLTFMKPFGKCLSDTFIYIPVSSSVELDQVLRRLWHGDDVIFPY